MKISALLLSLLGIATSWPGAILAAIPKTPVGLMATATTPFRITISWQDVSSDETGFELERSLDGKTFVKLAVLAANTVTYPDTGLVALTSYWYRLRALNASGFSAYSNIATATTPQSVPAAPEGLTAISFSQTQINLGWTDKASNETAYQVERSLDGATFARIADLAANVIAYQNTGLLAGTRYYFRVRAVNAVGPSAYSNVSSAITQQIPVPDMPGNLTAVPLEPELIQLRWSAVTGNATETIIERSKGNDQNFVQIAKVAATELQYADREKLENANYYYRIKANNAGGSSPYSPIAIVPASTIITSVETQTNGSLIYLEGKTLVAKLSKATQGLLAVHDLRGLLHTRSAITSQARLDLAALSAGLYIVSIETDQEVITRKILLY